MKRGSVYIIAGLSFRNPEDSASAGITVLLANRLRKTGYRVVIASHHEWQEVLQDIKSRPAGEIIILIGHSLGGSILPTLARMAGRAIAAMFGFDPANNPAANATVFALTKVPRNVKLASALVEGGIGLGGGMYEAEDPLDDKHPSGSTAVFNKKVSFGHLLNDDDIEEHLAITETARILLAA